MGGICCPQRITNFGHGVFPRDRLVVRCALGQKDWMSDAPLSVEFIIAEFSERLDTVLRKEGRVHICLHGFIGHRFGAVLTEFESGTVIGVWPGAPWTIKPFLLVHHRTRLDGLDSTHL